MGVTANQPEIVRDLLSLGADINACDVKGQTALHLAAHYGLPAVLQVTHSSRFMLTHSERLPVPSGPERSSFSVPPQVILGARPRLDLEARNYEGSV